MVVASFGQLPSAWLYEVLMFEEGLGRFCLHSVGLSFSSLLSSRQATQLPISCLRMKLIENNGATATLGPGATRGELFLSPLFHWRLGPLQELSLVYTYNEQLHSGI